MYEDQSCIVVFTSSLYLIASLRSRVIQSHVFVVQFSLPARSGRKFVAKFSKLVFNFILNFIPFVFINLLWLLLFRIYIGKDSLMLLIFLFFLLFIYFEIIYVFMYSGCSRHCLLTKRCWLRTCLYVCNLIHDNAN